MARYRKVEVATWNDDRFLSLSAPQSNGQTLWLYLLCGPRTTTFPGLVTAREEVMASDLGWTLKGFREAYGELSSHELVKDDWKAGLVLLRKSLFDSSGEPRDTAKPSNPNVLKNWSLSWEVIPECDLKFEYLHSLGLFADSLGETFAKAFREAFAKPLLKASTRPSPNQESGSGVRKQEQDTKNSAAPAACGSPFDVFKAKVDKAVRTRRPKPSEPTADELTAALRVLSKLTERNGVKYSGTTDHIGLIVRHLRNGVPEMHLRYVIGYCAAELEWASDPEMAKYLRPETLFGPKTLSKYLDPALAWIDKLPVEPAQEQMGVV
jgi:uncharacterized phage protein (TIGR02220 family)